MMKPNLPSSIYLLSAGIFLMISCELQVLGMMKPLTQNFSIQVSDVGYLVSAFAASMAIFGPMITLAFSRLPPKKLILLLYIVFILGELLGAVANNYFVLLASRVITGAVSGAFFGVAVGISGRLVANDRRLDAVALVLAGIMLGNILGLPLAKMVSELHSWNMSFYLVSCFALFAAILSLALLPNIKPEAQQPIKMEIAALKSKKLWWVYATSFFVISAAYAPFSYIVPILTDVSSLSENAVTAVLFFYGIAMLIGNQIVAKLAVKSAKTVIYLGISLVALSLLTFYFLASNTLIAVVCTLLIGFCGVSLNPALVDRLMTLPQGQRAFIHTVHTSVITAGIMFGSFIAALTLDAGFSMLSPLLVGVWFALGAIAVLFKTPPFKERETSYCQRLDGETDISV